MHPYLFFNKNRTSITHVGLQFQKRDFHTVLLDTYTGRVIKDRVEKDLFEFLTKFVRIPTQSFR